MIRYRCLAVIKTVVTFATAVTLILPLTVSATSPETAAETIRQRLESSLFTFEPSTQKHFALRMYRLTGDERYIQPILFDLLVTAERFERDAAGADDTAYVTSRCAEIRESLNPATRKGRLRLAMFEKWGGIDFYLNLLHRVNKLSEYGLSETSRFKPAFEQAMAAIQSVDFAPFLLDTGVIRLYSPQAVNYVYYLKDLGVVDLRDQYKKVFVRVFNDDLDNDLTKRQYMDKIYGLTHFITAASGYYQRLVDSSEFDWILDYFDSHRDRIVKETKADIIAEVGVCYLLAGRGESPMVEACREAIISRLDPETGLVPSLHGHLRLPRAEHRNIMAYILLAWSGRLYSGPTLPRFEAYQNIFENVPGADSED
jgi:hypothetical protein